MKVHSIGTIIQMEDIKAIIAGYDFFEKENRLVLHYIVLPIPRGYARKEDLKIVDAHTVSVVSVGFENEASDYYSRFLEQVCKIAEQCSAEEMREYLNAAITQAERQE